MPYSTRSSAPAPVADVVPAAAPVAPAAPAAKKTSPDPSPATSDKAAAARQAAREEAAAAKLAEANRRFDELEVTRLTEKMNDALAAKQTLERMAAMQAELHTQREAAAAATAAAALEAMRAERDAALEGKATAEAANAKYAERVAELEASVAQSDLELAALRAGAKAQRKRKASEPPEGASASVFQARMADGDAADPPAKRGGGGAKPFADFTAEKVPFDVDAPGAKEFFAFLGVKTVDDLKEKLESDSEWLWAFMALKDTPFRTGDAPFHFGTALRAMAEGPWEVDGQKYKKKSMWYAHYGWPELNVTHETKKIVHPEHTGYIFNQLKKVVNGMNQVIQAYNLYMTEISDEEFTPITMTAPQETFRKEQPMLGMSMIRAHKAGVPLKEYLKSLAPVAAADEGETSAAGEAAADAGAGEATADVGAAAADVQMADAEPAAITD